MIKKIFFSLCISLSAASAHGAASEAVEDDAPLSLWDAAAQITLTYDPKDAYTTLLFTRMVWLNTFGQRCINCSIPHCASNKFFTMTAPSILLNRTTLNDALASCSAITCLQRSAQFLTTAAQTIGTSRINFHTAGVLFDICTVTAKTELDAQITADEHEACVHHVQVSILSP